MVCYVDPSGSAPGLWARLLLVFAFWLQETIWEKSARQAHTSLTGKERDLWTPLMSDAARAPFLHALRVNRQFGGNRSGTAEPVDEVAMSVHALSVGQTVPIVNRDRASHDSFSGRDNNSPMPKDVLVDQTKPYWVTASRLKLARMLMCPEASSLEQFLEMELGMEEPELSKARTKISKYESGNRAPQMNYLLQLEHECFVPPMWVLFGRRVASDSEFRKRLRRSMRGDTSFLPSERRPDVVSLVEALRGRMDIHDPGDVNED